MILIVMFVSLTVGIVDYETNHTPDTDPGWSTAERIQDIKPDIREQ